MLYSVSIISLTNQAQQITWKDESDPKSLQESLTTILDMATQGLSSGVCESEKAMKRSIHNQIDNIECRAYFNW